MSNFVPTEQHLRKILLYFILKKGAALKVIVCSYKCMVTIFYPKEVVKFGFNDSEMNDKECSGASKKLKSLFHEESCQTFKGNKND